MNTKQLKLTPNALSVLETDVFDHVEGSDPDDGYEAIRIAYRNPGVLVATSTNADALATALNDLSNACADESERKNPIIARRADEAEEKKVYRAAAKTFATLADKARRA